MSDLTNRYEILFLYECTDCNPNGDPLDENRPRTDPDTGEATITDVRIKRTVRDYFIAQEPDVEKRLANGKEILIRDTEKPDGTLSQGSDRAKQFSQELTEGKKKKGDNQKLQEVILSQCIDARLFGTAVPLGKGESSLKLTGPVQFSAFNRSLHKVSPVMVQQTAAFASKATAQQKGFAERWLVPYALIAAYGMVNEGAAQTTHMTKADLDDLLDGLWFGTAALNTHSKMGHDPLLLIVAEYTPGQHIGKLSRRIKLVKNEQLEDTALRSTDDYQLDVSRLLNAFKDCQALNLITVKQDNTLQCQYNKETGDFLSLAKQVGLSVKKW
ncbi:CRISPR-associated protein TM1801 [Beggiatoa sp. PS]|nr:CRISPR-associated protein TM1801 [Beggiatoa sp. PS]